MKPPTKWKVIFRDGGKLRLRRFGEDLSTAIAFYRERKATGEESHLVCANKGFAPFKRGHKRYEERPSSRHLWCPYCMRYRLFAVTRIRDREGQISEAENRCPVCTIPVSNFNVRKYNGLLEHLDMEALKKQVGAW